MSDPFIELGLLKRRKSDAEDSIVRFAKCLDRFLALFEDIAVVSDVLQTGQFRSQLDRYRTRIIRTADPSALAQIAEASLALVQDYFGRGRKYLLDRETEFAQAIDVLRNAVRSFSDSANSFNDSFGSSSERLNGLIAIEDISELKRQILVEVQALQSVIEEKKKQDQASFDQLSTRIESLQNKLNEARQEASLDPLTRVANRGAFDRALERYIYASAKVVMAMMDVDNFKEINDTHGHPIGDQVLLCVSKWLGNSIRTGDLLARYGGDEFVILLVDISLAQAELRLSEVLERISTSAFEYRKGGTACAVRLALSCGMAELRPGDSAEDLLRYSDQALYEAKRRGKNCLVISRQAPS